MLAMNIIKLLIIYFLILYFESADVRVVKLMSNHIIIICIYCL